MKGLSYVAANKIKLLINECIAGSDQLQILVLGTHVLLAQEIPAMGTWRHKLTQALETKNH